MSFTIISTEFAKALSYRIAVKYFNGRVSQEELEAIHRGDLEGIELAKGIADAEREEVEMIERKCAGGKRPEFVKGVWEHYGLGGLKVSQEELSDKRVYIKNPIINALSERINPNIAFFEKLKEYGLALGLITLSKSEDVERQFEVFGIPRIFDRTECCGDPEYDSFKKENQKQGYIRLAKGLGVEAGETITFEDTEGGVHAACSAGIPVIGLAKDKDLPEAEFVVYEGLGPLIKAAEMFKVYDKPTEVIDALARYMHERGMRFRCPELQM